ncbi:MAG TPA: SprT family zinc-dependent metalloprotease [Sphingomicrobium sp.]|nr:SprT family zinc-dependent metalloprotease [Sphingomicrobium sp.]
MPETSKVMSSTARSEPLAIGLPLPVEIRPVRGARRLGLRMDERRGILKLTCPLRYPRAKALAWASEQREWVEAQLAAALPGEPFEPGAVIPLDGRCVQLVWEAGRARTPTLEQDRIVCGGPPDAFPARIERFLRRMARDLLSRETADLAALARAEVISVGVGDADTRWGSCSSAGRIRYSWRLVLAPPEARRYVVAHEVAHLVHLNHGPDFKALEAQLFGGDCASARALLRSAGPRLRSLGRDR